MYSVVESLAPPHEFLHQWLLWDVHPPLYQVLLRGWMAIFGSGEVATRLLSLFFVIVALLMMARLTAGRPFGYRIMAVAFLGVSPALAYYGQETRSYGMVLALSTIVTLQAMNLRAKAAAATWRERWMYVLMALLLSLTHYFGLAWVLLMTALQILKPTTGEERRQGWLLLPLLFLWPITHAVFGEITSKTGGNFWIKLSVPWLSSINVAISGLLPGMELSRQPQRLVRWAIVLGLLAVFINPRSRWRRSGRLPSPAAQLLLRQSGELALLILVFIAGMAVVDLHTPITTARNFIVLLPALALSMAGALENLAERLQGAGRWVLFSLVALSLALLLKGATTAVAIKASPPSNWKDLSVALQKAGLCGDGCLSDFANTYFTYYFKGVDLRPLSKEGSLPPKPLVLLDPLESANNARFAGRVCFQAQQTGVAPVVLLPPGHPGQAALIAAGLTPCPATPTATS